MRREPKVRKYGEGSKESSLYPAPERLSVSWGKEHRDTNPCQARHQSRSEVRDARAARRNRGGSCKKSASLPERGGIGTNCTLKTGLDLGMKGWERALLATGAA